MYAVIQRQGWDLPAQGSAPTAGTHGEGRDVETAVKEWCPHPQSVLVQRKELGTATVKDIITEIRGVTSFNRNF